MIKLAIYLKPSSESLGLLPNAEFCLPEDKVTIYTRLYLDGEYNLIAQQPLHSFNVKNFVMTPTPSPWGQEKTQLGSLANLLHPSTSCKTRRDQTPGS